MAQSRIDEELVKSITNRLAAKLYPTTNDEMVFCRESISYLYDFIKANNLTQDWSKVVNRYISIAQANKNLEPHQIIKGHGERLKGKTTTNGFQV